MVIMEVKDKLGRKIKLTAERKQHIKERHKELIEYDLFDLFLREPDMIRSSEYDNNVLFYYTKTKNGFKYIVLVVRVLNGGGFILTAYKTNNIKGGRIVWKI